MFFSIQRGPYHNNIVEDKDSNLFIECAAKCVHLCPQGEECTSSSWWDSTMSTPRPQQIHRQDANKN